VTHHALTRKNIMRKERRSFMKRFVISVFFALGLTLLSNASFAQQEDMLKLHTTEPLAIPGHVLPAGEYVFRLVEGDQYPHMVEVMRADGSSLYGLFQLAPVQRTAFSGDSAVTLTAPDATGFKRISQWYFPGAKNGYQFVYSKKDIQKQDQIARNNRNSNDSGLQ
jgi:hypothetical protein